MRHGKQVQIMVAEYDDCVVAQRTYKPQHLQRGRSAVHQVADKVDLVAIGREGQAAEECLQLIVATLDVADGIAGHCTIPGIASRKAAIGASNRIPSSVTIS